MRRQDARQRRQADRLDQVMVESGFAGEVRLVALAVAAWWRQSRAAAPPARRARRSPPGSRPCRAGRCRTARRRRTGSGRQRRPLGPSKQLVTLWPSACNSMVSTSLASTLSSISSIRHGSTAGRAVGALPARCSCSADSGNVTTKHAAFAVAVAGRPRTLPPCSWVIERTSDKPMPRPPWARSSERNPWVNRSKMNGCSSGRMPAPSSLDGDFDAVADALRR